MTSTPWWLAWIALAGAALGGCTSPGPSSGPNALPFLSGSRLRARVLDGGDGARRRVGWIDTQLGVQCEFEFATDGRVRCLPVSTFSTRGYLDPGCTQPVTEVFAAPGCVDAAGWAWSSSAPADVCAPAMYSVGPLGPRLDAGARRYLRDAVSGGCVADPTPPTGVLYGVMPAVAPERFVEAAAVTVSWGERLGARAYRTGDGAEQLLGPFDLQRGAPCRHHTLELVGLGRRCVVDGVATDSGHWYAGPDCGAAVAWGDASCDARPPSWVLRLRDNDVTLHAIGGPATSPAYVRASDGTCAPDAQSAALQFWTTGAAAGPDAVPEVPVRRIGTGRLRALFVGGSESSPSEFFDTLLGVDCRTVRIGATLYCVPGAVGEFPRPAVFTDAACTLPALRYTSAARPPATPPPLPAQALVDAPGLACDGGPLPRTLHDVLGRHDGTVYALFNGRCEATVAVPSSTTLRISDALPPTAFAPITDRVE